jgi:surface polysaccharide O-acyltransferase-like enzyme
MFKRTLIFGAALFVFVSAVIISLAILDIISFQEVKLSLRRFLGVIAVSTVAIILIHKLFCLAKQESSEKNSSSLKISGPSPKGEKSDSE